MSPHDKGGTIKLWPHDKSHEDFLQSLFFESSKIGGAPLFSSELARVSRVRSGPQHAFL
jgi:hypothetical protein